MTAAEKDMGDIYQAAPDRRADPLLRLAADPQKLAAERKALPKAFDARLWALLREIDETVLPRVLCLHSAGRELARLIVSHRSLISVETPGASSGAGDQKDLVVRCAAGLAAIANVRGDLSITTRRRKALPNQAEAAASVRALELALGLTPAQSPFDRLSAELGPLALAQLRWSDKVAKPQFTGASDWAGLLQAVVGRYGSMGKKRPTKARVGPQRTEGVVIPLSARLVMVVASLEKAGFAVIVPRQAGLDAVAACQKS